VVDFAVSELPMEVFVPREGDGFLVEDFTRIPYGRLSVMNEVYQAVK
jgi:hypothetical protein